MNAGYFSCPCVTNASNPEYLDGLAVSNGKLARRQDNPSDKTTTFDWRQEIPHPSYLVTLVVGQFDVVRHEWEGIPVLYYVPKGHRAEAGRGIQERPAVDR